MQRQYIVGPAGEPAVRGRISGRLTRVFSQSRIWYVRWFIYGVRGMVGRGVRGQGYSRKESMGDIVCGNIVCRGQTKAIESVWLQWRECGVGWWRRLCMFSPICTQQVTWRRTDGNEQRGDAEAEPQLPLPRFETSAIVRKFFFLGFSWSFSRRFLLAPRSCSSPRPWSSRPSCSWWRWMLGASLPFFWSKRW